MGNIKETLNKKLSEYLPAAIVGALTYLFAVAWKEILLPLAKIMMPELSKTGLLAIILIQFLVLIIAFAYLFVSRSKRRQYRFDKRLGIYFHKKTNGPFCTSCLTTDIESPLKESKSGWHCQRKECDKWYSNPDYKEPPEPERHRGSTWMSR